MYIKYTYNIFNIFIVHWSTTALKNWGNFDTENSFSSHIGNLCHACHFKDCHTYIKSLELTQQSLRHMSQLVVCWINVWFLFSQQDQAS